MSFLEKFAGSFFQNRGSKWPEYLTMLDPAIQNVFHFRPARVGKNASLPQRARAPFNASLKPAQYFSVSDMFRCGDEQGFFVHVHDACVISLSMKRVDRLHNTRA